MDCCDVCDYMFLGEPPDECPMCKIGRQEARIAELEAAMQVFCDRVDKGEARSVKTYAAFKALLGEATDGEGE